MARRKKKKKKDWVKITLTIFVSLIIIAGAVALIFLYREYIFPSSEAVEHFYKGF